MKTNGIPAIITLVAAAIDCVISLVSRVTLMVFLRRLLIVLIVFYVIGCIIKIILDLNFPEMEEKEGDGETEPAEGEEADSEAAEGEDAETAEGEQPDEGETEDLENINADEVEEQPKAG